jgi:hypothetical protein
MMRAGGSGLGSAAGAAAGIAMKARAEVIATSELSRAWDYQEGSVPRVTTRATIYHSIERLPDR